MRRYRKRPVVVEAVQWTGDNTTEIIDWIIATGTRSARWHEAVGLDEAAEARRPRREHIAINTPRGTAHAMPGDWIVRGAHGDHHPCHPDIFAATYEPAEQGDKA